MHTMNTHVPWIISVANRRFLFVVQWKKVIHFSNSGNNDSK